MGKLGASVSVDVGECEAIVRLKAATLKDLWDKLAEHGLAEPKEEKPILELSPEDPLTSPEELVRVWNANRGPLPECRGLNKPRTSHARQRLKEQPNLEEWARIVRYMAMDEFFAGRKPGSTWKADFDYLIKPGTRLKLLERMTHAQAPRKDFKSLLDPIEPDGGSDEERS